MSDMKKIKHKLVKHVDHYIDNHSMDNINAEELGEVIDMINDICEAIYYDDVAEAMERGNSFQYNGATHPAMLSNAMLEGIGGDDTGVVMGKPNYHINAYDSNGYDDQTDFGRYKDSYMEAQKYYSDNSPESNEIKMQELKSFIKALTSDLDEMFKSANTGEISEFKKHMISYINKL